MSPEQRASQALFGSDYTPVTDGPFYLHGEQIAYKALVERYRAEDVAIPPHKGYVDIVFDGPPGPVCGRFVEVENTEGKSISFGDWVERSDGYWALRIRGARS